MNRPENSVELPVSNTAKAWTQWDISLLLVSVALLILFRMHAFSAPLEVDECNYAYVGERLLQGDQLYLDVWDHQPPGVFGFTAVLVAILGSSPIVFRIGATLAAASTLILVFAICRRHLPSKACWLAAIIYAISSSDPGIGGEGCNREIYMNLLAVVALWFILAQRWWAVLIAGLCLGISSLFKTVAAGQWLLLLIGLLIAELHSNRSWKPLVKIIALMSIGPAVVWVGTFLYFLATDRLVAFVNAVFVYNMTYGHVDLSPANKVADFFSRGFASSVFVSGAAIWIAGIVGTCLLPWKRNTRLSLVISAFCVGSFAAVCLPGWFWRHYYMLLLPSLAIGAAALFGRIILLLEACGGKPKTACMAYSAILILATACLQSHYYLLRKPTQLSSPNYSLRMAWARQQGKRLATVTEEQDSVYVWGMDVGIYYYSGRRCATRFTLNSPLVQDSPLTAARQAQFMTDLKDNPPRVILLTPQPVLPALDEFIRDRGYQMAGNDEQRMVVLTDPSRPIERIDWTFLPRE